MTQIKICGFTDPKEAAFISYPDVSYMGMVLFFEKSKRNISLETAKAIMRAADPRIQKVAVVASPTVAQAKVIDKAGFDFLQVHGVLREDVLIETAIPIIRAYNGGAGEEAESPRICAYLFDAAEPGSQCRKGDFPRPSRCRRRIVGGGVYRQEGEGSGENSGVYSGCQRKLMLDASCKSSCGERDGIAIKCSRA